MPSFEELSDEQRAQLSRVGFQLFHNPEVSKEAKRLLMKANPKVRFPEIEAEETVNTAMKSRDEKIAEMEGKLLEQEMNRRLEEKRATARERGLDPADIEALIVERGKQNRVIDWESAMELLEYQKQSAAATPVGNTWKPANQLPGVKEMLESADPARLASENAHKIIDELRGRRRA
jgi:hypothetical protein